MVHPIREKLVMVVVWIDPTREKLVVTIDPCREKPVVSCHSEDDVNYILL